MDPSTKIIPSGKFLEDQSHHDMCIRSTSTNVRIVVIIFMAMGFPKGGQCRRDHGNISDRAEVRPAGLWLFGKGSDET